MIYYYFCNIRHFISHFFHEYLFHTEKALTILHFIEASKVEECLNRIYHSKLYKKLSTENTKYWHLGPVDLYEELKREL